MQHVGIRGGLNDWEDYEDDYAVDFVISHAWDAEDIGWQGIVEKIRDTVGDNPVYSAALMLVIRLRWIVDTVLPIVTLDIDVIDPGMAPA